MIIRDRAEARLARRLAVLLAGVCLPGCQSLDMRVSEAFPPARSASPWVQQGAVWSGDFVAARPALGADAPRWARHAPAKVWISSYAHEDDPDRRLTARCFALADEAAANAAYADACPQGARALDLADVACWAASGVAFRCGRLVVEVFGDDASWSSEVQSAVLAAQLAKRLDRSVGAAR